MKVSKKKQEDLNFAVSALKSSCGSVEMMAQIPGFTEMAYLYFFRNLKETIVTALLSQYQLEISVFFGE